MQTYAYVMNQEPGIFGGQLLNIFLHTAAKFSLHCREIKLQTVPGNRLGAQ
jgi:hypothetical protein